ncbi:thiosulfate/3-mercaptopyruvate sulfurtransferase [Georgenia soli]|uniref:Thiosulfate/3-mercaptopyruvate sulfurtransferase n=1 Tax=Georgenia soli TaxID=638953 RepID=A0A2A9EQG1_9MICO|nr:sulfurtransferase [Georgenia soli]PFG40480.1 thiosulfate/3-mercaptopyruvate sulfurtransferase [Georgenia soli]
MREQVLVTAEELAQELASARPPAVLDVRWSLARPDGRADFRAGHVPGAVFVDLETELAAPPSAAAGRHPLPDPADLQAAARRWGLRRGSRVVVYDDVGGTSAARAWWLLRWAGLEDVRILDGALAAWTRAGGALESGDVVPSAGDVVLPLAAGTAGPGMPTTDADGAAAWPGHGLLLDARAPERYRGEVEPVDPRAGHVPGARSAPTTANLGEDGTFLPEGELRRRLAEVGADEGAAVAVYCGSGVTAAHAVAALASIGVDAALYPGSWSQWSADPARPAATGARP